MSSIEGSDGSSLDIVLGKNVAIAGLSSVPLISDAKVSSESLVDI